MRQRIIYIRNILWIFKKTNLKNTQKIITRFSGNEELCNRIWRKQETNICRLCQSENETLKHLATIT